MSDVRYGEVVNVLLEHFPEFMQTDEYKLSEPDSAYTVYGGFGRFMTNYIRSVPADRLDEDQLIGRAFEFINELMSSGDTETQNIIIVELFEQFYGYSKTLDVARRKLRPEHLPWLEK